MTNTMCSIGKMVDPGINWDLNFPISGDPVIVPVDGPIGAPVDDDNFRSFQYFGQITDATTGDPIPGATVKIFDANGTALAAGAADKDGYYSLSSLVEADKVQITSAGYIGKLVRISLLTHDFSLERNEIELPPVVVTSHKNNWTWIALLGLVVIADQK